ncbi:chemotaxis protein CheA [Oceanicoccus sagamiensis]|uniref:Chemotaxis protein CheA n=1 Tax=Oceanicoccus sagamiensis TaxID=716816 RepID=A0A1X9NGM1_9GAMM|nr:chemotaxis protein CheA [Oceanicoccus sagamiensis]ARN74659.1 hypothetical protein BST96_11310 [Oceanicoccus sagamiensis]
MSDLQALFVEEAQDLLPELEEALLELENNNDDLDLVARIFRAMHTIKGSGAMCDFPNIASFTHELENVFDLVRKGDISVNKKLVEIGLSSHNYITELIDSADQLNPRLREEGNHILAQLSVYAPIVGDISAANPDENHHNKDTSQQQKNGISHFRIHFVPEPALLTYGINPLNVLQSLLQLGEVYSQAYVESLPKLAEIDETLCYTSWVMVVKTIHSRDEVADVFSLVEEDSEVTITAIDITDEDAPQRLGEILLARGDIQQEQLAPLCEQPPLLGEKIVNSGLLPQEKVDSALVEQNLLREQRQQTQSTDNVRVSSARLDSQMDLVGELVIALAGLKQYSQSREDARLSLINDELEQLVTSIRDNVLGIRMLPIGGIFGKFRRLVRDLSNEQGKQIELLTEGAETELDKTVIDQLSEPLVHLIRNSLDHGIELPEQRIAAGKDPLGKITLSAKHAQGQVIIQIKDDGGGIDADKVWEKVLEKGLSTQQEKPAPKDILAFIFAPGFSTAATITSISGRGVGMDVVKKAIESLRGSIDIDSVVGVGSTITLRLPLTLAIIDGLLVRVGAEILVVPLAMVEECVETTRGALKYSAQGQLIRVRDTLVPCLPLQNWAGSAARVNDDIQIVIVSVEGQCYGLIVDDVVGQEQIVIKSLGRIYQAIEGVSGATILGDGAVALILDLVKIVQLFDSKENV